MKTEIDKIAYLRIENGKILSARSKGKATFYFPGGKREAGESDKETLIREIAEELTIAIVPATIQYVETFRAQADGHPSGVVVKMTCYSAEYAGEIKPNQEIEEIRWLNFADIDLVSEVDKIIFRFLKERGELF